MLRSTVRVINAPGFPAGYQAHVYEADAVTEALESRPWSGGTRRVTALLMPGDAAWNSASTKHELHGPCSVTWVQYLDGAIDTLVSC